MSTTTAYLRVAVKKSARHPHTRVRLLGPRAAAQPGEVIVPLALRIDDAWFRRELARAVLDVAPPPDEPALRLTDTPT